MMTRLKGTVRVPTYDVVGDYQLLVEPTGAVPFALVRAGRVPDMAGKRVGVVLSGGNVDADVLASILQEA